MYKKLFYILGIISIPLIGFILGINIAEKISTINPNTQKAEIADLLVKTPIIPDTKETTLVFLGDMMFDRGVESSVNKNFGGDFNKLFENIPEIKDADILFANLEGPVSDTGNNVGSKYSFRMNPKILQTIKDVGFDIVSFANNHVGDWNVIAFNDTLAKLDNIGILKTGAGINKKEVETPTIIEKNGIKFGFLGFSDVGPAWVEAKENKAGILLANDKRLPEIIQNAKNSCDVLIVSFHFGDEYKVVHNARQEQLAKISIDNGADLIIGHHPHVMEDIDIYKDKTIVYSLGNFIFDQYFSKDTMRGMLFEAIFKGKEIKNTETKIITLKKNFQPEGIFTIEEQKERDEEASSICPKPNKEYEDMFLLNVGQDVSLLNITYIPKNLREIESESSTKSGICLTKEAKEFFELMTSKARSDGYIIEVSSGFRSYDTQKVIIANKIKNGDTNTDIAVAKAGHSEHQLGTAVDITGQSIKYVSASDSFEKTPEAKWMEENASDYGFIESYPEGKENITGYMYEPWHYRYVGIDNAKEIIKRGMTINEYLKELSSQIKKNTP